MSFFQVQSGHISISDPAHPKDFQFDVWNIPAKNGIWDVKYLETPDSDEFGRRTSMLSAEHRRHKDTPLDRLTPKFLGLVCVDYGSLVIADSDFYPQEGYKVEDVIKKLESDVQHITVDGGIATTTGFGADNYKPVGYFLGEQIVKLHISFISDESIKKMRRICTGQDAEGKKDSMISRNLSYLVAGTISNTIDR